MPFRTELELSAAATAVRSVHVSIFGDECSVVGPRGSRGGIINVIPYVGSDEAATALPEGSGAEDDGRWIDFLLPC